MASTLPSPGTDEDRTRRRIVEEATALVATGGIRGATLRDVAARCGASVASIAYLFGNKDGLIAECFAQAVERDRARLAALAEESATLAIPPALAGPFLWTLCEEAAGDRRADMLVLVELWLSAAANPRLAEICRDWLRMRRDAFRGFARLFGADPLAFDLLGLHLLSESSFAVSCHGSAAWRLLARAGFIEAVARIAGLGTAEATQGIADLAVHFFADPETDRARDPAEARGGRGAESRARIVDAAASIIEEEGLAAVTNRAVAERAAVSLALTTYHFKSVTELAFAGILRVFEKVNEGFVRDSGASPQASAVVARIRNRSQPSGVERLRSRGMAEISLAAARSPALDPLGIAMRRQRGTITHASLGRGAHGGVTRTRAASHALWSSAAFLTAAAIGEADALYDFESQARLAARTLLEID
jgi:AcrR family transcriptional regulator